VCFGVALLLIPVPGLHAESDPERAPVAALLDELSSGDAAVRRAAADRIVDAGYFAIERVARRAASLDAEAWQTFADAVLRRTWRTRLPPPPVGALVAAAHVAPEAHRRRLIALARRLNPEAGKTPTPEAIAAVVRRELVEKKSLVDDNPGGDVVIFGHAAMPAVFKLLREGEPGTVDLERASAMLSDIAQPEDIPALRKLLLEGKLYVVDALHRLDALGYAQASDVLIEAVRAGRFDPQVARAISEISIHHEAAARAVREWVGRRGQSLTDEDRVWATFVFQELHSREDIPTLEAWISSSSDPGILHGLGRALTKLGSAKGIDLLVRIAEGERAKPPFGRLTARGIDEQRRRTVIGLLAEVAVQVSSSGSGSPTHGSWKVSSSSELDHVAATVRAWWEASREKMQFDAEAGAWRLKAD